MKFLIIRLIRWLSVRLGEIIINFISEEQTRFSGLRLYVRILLFASIPVFFFEIGFWYVKEYIAVFLKKYFVYKYYSYFNQLNFSILTLMKTSYIGIDIFRTMLIVAFIVWYRTTSDIITRNVVNELQEHLDEIDKENIDKKLVEFWIEHIQCIVYVYNENLEIIMISRFFREWFKRHNISITLIGMNILASPFCENKTYRNRAIFAFDNERCTDNIETYIFGGREFTFNANRKRIKNGGSIIVVTLTRSHKNKEENIING